MRGDLIISKQISLFSSCLPFTFVSSSFINPSLHSHFHVHIYPHFPLPFPTLSPCSRFFLCTLPSESPYSRLATSQLEKTPADPKSFLPHITTIIHQVHIHYTDRSSKSQSNLPITIDTNDSLKLINVTV